MIEQTQIVNARLVECWKCRFVLKAVFCWMNGKY